MKFVKNTVALAAVFIASVFATMVVAFPASAAPKFPPPGPAACDGPDLPPCAPIGMDPNLQCALVAWRTWMPCNMWGVRVPEGTPGSLSFRHVTN